MKRLFSMLLLCLFPLTAQAQFYPDYTSTTVNDFAGLLPEATQAQIHEQLTQLRNETGIEMTVVTLTKQATYDPEATFEAFATGLFNHWGIGDADRNDGIMVLVIPQDRTMRLELGAGYNADWNYVAENVVQDVFLPPFRNGDYPTGIAKGVTATIDKIALPLSKGRAAPARQDKGDNSFWMFLIAIPVLLVVFMGKIKQRFTRCPKCNTRGSLDYDDTILKHPTKSTTGQKRRIVTCNNCDYHDTRSITMSRKTSSSSSSSFGGGSSSGGGASGRW